MRYVTPSDADYINMVIKNLKDTDSYGLFSFTDAAKITGWSVTTVRKYYDKNWTSPKTNIGKIIVEGQTSGIYMLGNIIVQDGKIKYFLKVGKANNLAKRIGQYKGMNPTAECIGTLKLPENTISKKEKEWHKYLSIKGQRIKGTEWFEVGEETYNNYKTNGFKW